MKTITNNNIFANFKWVQLPLFKYPKSRVFIMPEFRYHKNSQWHNFTNGDYQVVIK